MGVSGTFKNTWIPGSSPGMTNYYSEFHFKGLGEG